MRITHQLLVDLTACEPEREAFDKIWPDGAEVTIENATRAVEAGLDLLWLGTVLFRAKFVYPIEELYQDQWEECQTFNQVFVEADRPAQAIKVQECERAKALYDDHMIDYREKNRLLDKAYADRDKAMADWFKRQRAMDKCHQQAYQTAKIELFVKLAEKS